jgi:hypothetical protein
MANATEGLYAARGATGRLYAQTQLGMIPIDPKAP